MTKENFIKKVVEEIGGYLPEQYRTAKISVVDAQKNNTNLKGLVIMNPDRNITPTIYLDGFFEDYTQGREFDDILKEISSIRSKFEQPDVDVEKITSFENMKNVIIPRLFSIKDNPLLGDLVYVPVDDTGLAVTFAARIDMGPKDEGVGNIPISKGLAETWEVSTEELYDLAINNSRRINPPQLTPMNDIIYRMKKEEFEEAFGEDAREVFDSIFQDTNFMFVASNKNNIYGASVILDKDFMQEVQEKLEKDLVIIPSSVHEVIILPKSDELSYEHLLSMIEQVNDNEMCPQDRLSYELFTIHKNSLKKMSKEDFSEKMPVNLLD